MSAPDMNGAETPPDDAAPLSGETAPALPPGFHFRRDGLFYAPPDDADATALHICGRLVVQAATHDGEGQAWGAQLSWLDDDGREHVWAMPRAMLAGDGQEVRARLMDGGLSIAPGKRARDRLAEYLTRANPAQRVRVVSRIGWHGSGTDRVFVVPHGAVGAPGAEAVMLQTERPDALPPLREAGTLAEWQRDVAALAVGNSRLAFSIATAFAAPLLALVNGEGGGFHLRGASSVGKSTALHVAGSVWGGGGLRGWSRSWRATDNALEAVAAAHCDLLLCLDEMGEAGAETVASAAYMLANGAGKGRAARDGGARRSAEWRLIFLSTGEEGIADRMTEARGGPRHARAGQEIRVLDTPAEAGPHGLFEALHGHGAPGSLADALKAAAGRCYGTAGRAWLDYLAADPDAAAAAAREIVAAFMADHAGGSVAGQVRRAAGRFALVAAAGEMAAAVGILPWQPGEAERAAAACFAAWKARRMGGTGAAEDATTVAAVRAFIGAHGSARFEVIGDATPGSLDIPSDAPRVVVNRAGWRKRDGEGWRYFILPETWRREVVAGMDPVAAARALRKAGHLVPQSDTDGRHSRVERVPQHGLVRVMVVKDTILAGGAA